jgi:hypothetical protein
MTDTLYFAHVDRIHIHSLKKSHNKTMWKLSKNMIKFTLWYYILEEPSNDGVMKRNLSTDLGKGHFLLRKIIIIS